MDPPASTSSKREKQDQQYNCKQYDKIRVLGKGSFGTAVVHRRRADCLLVVLKEIDLQQFKGDKEKCLALNEARIMSSLSHVNIIQYYNAYTTETKLLIEMEYASMGTLANYLSLQTNPLNEHEILVIFEQIVSGVSYLHEKNIVHLDLKMANIFITVDGLVKIGDFGIAQYMQQDSLSSNNHHHLDRRSSMATGAATGTGAGKGKASANRRSLQPGGPNQSQHFAGTLAYSSPERCLGDATDFKSDIWSLGCILYELITAKPLFSGESLPEIVMQITRIQYAPIRRDLSAGLKGAFERMISRRPEDRPSAKELHGLVDELLAGRLRASSQQQQQRHNKIRKRQNHGLDLSTDAAAYMNNINNNNNNRAATMAQLRYPHSLIYQVRLDSRHIQIDRVNLPLTKRIKEICKGKSHYLALTYDSIVFGWGSRSHGELGSCGLGAASSSARLRASAGKLHLSPGNQPNEPAGHDEVAPGPKTGSSAKAFIINELHHRKIIQVAAGNDFSVFLSKTGIVMTCGDGSRGCLGRDNFKSSFTPCMVESLLNTDIVSIASGPEHVVAVCGNGKAFAWGNSSRGRLGIGTRDLTATNPSISQRPNQLAPESIPSGPLAGAGKFVSAPQPVRFNDDSVFIKSAFCGDRCTIFIDSSNRCWACGDNRSNRLALDVRRRFKKTLFVDCCWIPTEITALGKSRVVSCNIGKNHSTFLTTDERVLVYGQDIDQTYRLRSNIINGIDSHRRISMELQTNSRKGHHSATKSNTASGQSAKSLMPPIDLKELTKSTVINNQSSEFKQSKEDIMTMAGRDRNDNYPKYSLTKLQRQQVDTFLRKSRSAKRMPFECAIATSCTGKFSLALTNDNRVYFWGTRSFSHNEHDDDDEDERQRERTISRVQRHPEPQLVTASSDECFVKIGATNVSLMNTIQALGSDQPIVHGQDPRLTANTLADLWILDYAPASDTCSESSSSSSSVRSQESECDSDISSSCCSSCCSRLEPDVSVRKHDAILDPQPIVSLYVPPMFNHSGCSLQLVDLFCFDEDKFYLVLDTTVKMNQLTVGQAQSQQSVQQRHNVRDQVGQPRLRFNSFAAAAFGPIKPGDGNTGAGGSNTSGRKQTRRKSIGDETEAAKLNESSRINRQLDTLDAILESPKTTTLEGHEACATVAGVNCSLHLSASAGERSQDQESANITDETGDTANSTDDNNNINPVADEDDKTDLMLGQSPNPCSQSLVVASLDEPRSMSTFVANSLGNQIIVGPSMRLATANQTMEPLRFGDSLEEKSEMAVDHEELSSGSTTLAGDGDQANVSSAIRVQQNMNRRKSRQMRNKSESTTSFTCNETSPMPSWVRNEFNMQQQQQQQQQHHHHGGQQDLMQRDDFQFVVDSSSATEGTCIAEQPLFFANGAANSAYNDCELQNDNHLCGETCRYSPAPERLLATPNLATSFLSRSQPDIRNSPGNDEAISSGCHRDDENHLNLVDGLTTRRSFTDLNQNLESQADSIVRQSTLLDCHVYRSTNGLMSSTNRSNYLQTSTMNMSGLSTRSSSNNPLIGSPTLIRRAAELPLGGLDGRYTGMGSPVNDTASAIFDSNTHLNGTAYLLPSNSNGRHNNLQRSSSIMNGATKLHQQGLSRLNSISGSMFSKSVQQLSVNQAQTFRGKSRHSNGSTNSIASSIRKSLLKLFC